MEDEETSESEAALDLISSQFVDLCAGQSGVGHFDTR